MSAYGPSMSSKPVFARWLLPVIVGLVLFLPLGCVTGSGLCAEDAVRCSGESVTTCYSVVGVPTSGAVAAIGVPVVILVAAAGRTLLAQRRARAEQGTAST